MLHIYYGGDRRETRPQRGFILRLNVGGEMRLAIASQEMYSNFKIKKYEYSSVSRNALNILSIFI